MDQKEKKGGEKGKRGRVHERNLRAVTPAAKRIVGKRGDNLFCSALSAAQCPLLCRHFVAGGRKKGGRGGGPGLHSPSTIFAGRGGGKRGTAIGFFSPFFSPARDWGLGKGKEKEKKKRRPIPCMPLISSTIPTLHLLPSSTSEHLINWHVGKKREKRKKEGRESKPVPPVQ